MIPPTRVQHHLDLPLRYATPAAWAEQALADDRQMLALLNDHAHLEKKAANNALDLLCQWPDPTPPENWVAAMTAVARDEAEHLSFVTRLLARRGGRLSKNHSNPYANGLRTLVRKGDRGQLIDRLMVSALIEARSCERFALLGEQASLREDKELAKLYKGLWASEKGHYLTFLDLARNLPTVRNPAKEVDQRWDALLDAEAELIARQSPGPRMHSAPAI